MQEKVKELRDQSQKERGQALASVWRTRLVLAARELLWVGCACLFGQASMLFHTYPLGLALLCATRKHTLSILIGLVLSAFWQTEAPLVYVCTYAVAALVRVLTVMIFEPPHARKGLELPLRKKLRDAAATQEMELPEQGEHAKRTRLGRNRGTQDGSVRALLADVFTESVCLRMSTAAVCSFIVSLYRMIVGGFRYYDLFATLFVLAVTPAAVMVYSVFLNGTVKHRILCDISRAALLFSLIWSSVGIYVSGLPLSVMLSFFFTLWISRKEGVLLGTLSGILCGLADAPINAPAFLLAALAFALFKGGRRESFGVFFSAICAMIWSVYVNGAASLLIFVPAYLAAGAAFTLYVRLWASVETREASDDDSLLRLRMQGTRHQDSTERFRGISDAFSSLSEMFYNLSDRFRRPGTLDLRRLCDSAFDAFCTDCPNKTVCWGLEYSNTLGTVNALISALHTKGRVTRAQIAKGMLHRCEDVDRILERINGECAKLTGEMLRNNRTEIFAMDYESAAKIINDALEEDDGEYRFDDELEQRILEYLKDAKVGAHGVSVYGNRRRQIVVRGADVEHATVTVETLRADLEELCGVKLNRPVFEVEGNLCTMTLQAKKKIAVIGAQNNVSADGGVSGDSINLFSNKKDFFYALISDGMGAGKEAALTSGLCSVFLEKMLRAGNRAGTSIRMLNNMICSREANSTRECSSTVDLLELDLMTGRGSFIKSGAAPSFVIRGRVVHRF